MPDITKITTPMMPKENTSIKHKPITDQAFSLTDPDKVHKPENEGQIQDRQPDAETLLKDSLGRPAVASILKNPGEMMQAFKKIAFLIEMGVSASDAAKDSATRELLESLFIKPGEVADVIAEQDKSSVLFKGEAFDILRDIMGKFEGYPKVKDSVVELLKTFDRSVNTQNSIKTILNNCNNLLEYMFTRDKSQFSEYIGELAKMLLPGDEAAAFVGKADNTQFGQQPQPAVQENAQQQVPAQENLPQQGQSMNVQQNNPDARQATAQNGLPEQAPPADRANQAQNQEQQQYPAQERQNGAQAYDPLNQGLQTQKFGNELQQAARHAASRTGTSAHAAELSPKETAQILKNNLLPLLSEIVVKYNQSNKVRDMVMVVVHNIVRVDKGTPEALKEAVAKLTNELRDVSNLPRNFEKQFLEAITQSVKEAKELPNNIISKMSDIVSEALRSPNTNPAILRQAENMLVSMLQNQSSMMDILHFVIPFQTPQGQVFTELYVDPESEERVGKQKGKSHKIFLSVESEAHGSFELSFLATEEHVDFVMWAPEDLVESLSGLKRNFANIMQLHGYTMNTFKVDEMKAPHTVAEVFPRLIEKKVGIDVNV